MNAYASLISNQENAESTVTESSSVVDVEDLIVPKYIIVLIFSQLGMYTLSH